MTPAEVAAAASTTSTLLTSIQSQIQIAASSGALSSALGAPISNIIVKLSTPPIPQSIIIPLDVDTIVLNLSIAILVIFGILVIIGIILGTI